MLGFIDIRIVTVRLGGVELDFIKVWGGGMGWVLELGGVVFVFVVLLILDV